jgi:hypothetical protein
MGKDKAVKAAADTKKSGGPRPRPQGSAKAPSAKFDPDAYHAARKSGKLREEQEVFREARKAPARPPYDPKLEEVVGVIGEAALHGRHKLRIEELRYEGVGPTKLRLIRFGEAAHGSYESPVVGVLPPDAVKALAEIFAKWQGKPALPAAKK